MKRFTHMLSVLSLVLLSTSAFGQGHCALSDLFLDNVTDLGNNLYQIDLTFCTKGGSAGTYDGQSQNTFTFGFWLTGGATFNSFPSGIVSPQTGAIYDPFLGMNDTALAYTDMIYPQDWWTNIDGNSGPIATYCYSISLTTNGLPESLEIKGLEGGGNPAAGCQGYRVIVYPDNSGPDCSSLSGNINADKTQTYIGWTPESCANLTAQGLGGEDNYHYNWSNGECIASINVCPLETTTYTVTITDQDTGCTTSSDLTVEVEDIRCGNRDNKVLLCINGTTRCVRQNRVQRKLNKDASLGVCPNSSSRPTNSNLNLFNSDNILESNEMSIQPNPIREKASLTFKVDSNSQVVIALYNIKGELVRNIYNSRAEKDTSYELSIDRGELNAGLYIVRMADENGIITTNKIVFQ